MKIGIVHNRPAPVGAPNWQASQDVLGQVKAMTHALQELGHESQAIPFDRDLGRFVRLVAQEKIEGIVNLCETVDENPSLIGHPAAVFELLGLPFTGSPVLPLLLTTDKLTAKRQLAAAGLPTPDYFVYAGGELPADLDLTLPVLVKPRLEDASIGIDQESVVFTRQELAAKLPDFFVRHGELLVEQFIAGREFNISLLGFPEPRLLPLAEIDFSAFPNKLHHIVGYRAKWDEASFEFHHTNRCFPLDLAPELEHRLREVAAASFRLFMLRDYGRVDLRVDPQGRVFVLEANANPCLDPGAGFAAAAGQAGLSYPDLVRELISFMMRRGRP